VNDDCNSTIPVGPLDRPAAVETIIRLSTARTGVPVTADDDLFLAGLTSLDLVGLTGAIEQQFRVRLSVLDILDHPTACRLADLIVSRAADDARP
jgi:acyl carrier protein